MVRNIRLQHRIDQIVVECFEVGMRHHPRDPANSPGCRRGQLVGDRCRDPADLRGILKPQMHRAMSSSGQLAYQLLGVIEAGL